MDRKKEKELLYVELFKSQFADFPAGEIFQSETPDVLVHSESRCVGIEITEVFRSVRHGGHPIQKRENELHRIMQKARELYEEAGLPPVIVRAFFSDHPFSRADLLPTAKRLVEIVSRNLPDSHGEKVEDYDWLNRELFGEKIHTVTVNRHPKVTWNEWAAPEAMWIPEEGPELLQERLDAKEASHRSCRAKCDEVWLVILSGASGLSSMVRLNHKALEHEYITSFDRAFLFQDGGNILPIRKVKPES